MRWTSLGFLLLMVLPLASCQSDRVEQPEYFKKIFKGGEETFRGLDLGDDLQEVRKAEGGSPHNDDEFGLAYKLNLGEGEECLVEYMSLAGEERKLQSILVNVALAEEAQTTALYNEVEAFLRRRHGVPDGSFGNYEWKDEESNLDISMRMLSDKKSFSLNFARPL